MSRKFILYSVLVEEKDWEYYLKDPISVRRLEHAGSVTDRELFDKKQGLEAGAAVIDAFRTALKARYSGKTRFRQ